MRPAALTAAALAVVALALAACGDDDSGDDEANDAEPGAEATTTTTTEPEDVGDPELRDELLTMMEADQAERTGASTANGDAVRTERLRQIVGSRGWPTRSLVGTDGATAAWVIAQHADHDVGFQQEVLDLMAPLVETGEADPTEHAYLLDRVAVNTGADQTYGTQIRCQDGEPSPATPIADEDTVEERRAEVGLDPLADYYDELAEACAAEG